MSDQKLLVLDTPGPAGIALRLRAGDILVAINGVAFGGDLPELQQRFAPGRRLALTFLRAGQHVTVLCQTAELGKWQQRAQELAPGSFTRIDPDYLSNWEMFQSPDGLYDVQRLDRSLLALGAPVLWLLQMRMWRLLAAWVAMSLFASIAGLWAVAAVQLFMGLLFWRSGPDFVRAERRMRGLDPVLILAARSESAVHAELARLHPELTWACAPIKTAHGSTVDA